MHVLITFVTKAMKHRSHQVSIQALVNYLSGWNASAFFTLNK